MTKLVEVREVFTDGNGKTTYGVPTLMDLDTLVSGSTGMSAAANIAAVASPFASLTAAADAHNALLAALKAAGLMVAD